MPEVKLRFMASDLRPLVLVFVVLPTNAHSPVVGELSEVLQNLVGSLTSVDERVDVARRIVEDFYDV